MFATWYTASCNLQGLYRTAGTKNNSIHLHFQSRFWIGTGVRVSSERGVGGCVGLNKELLRSKHRAYADVFWFCYQASRRDPHWWPRSTLQYDRVPVYQAIRTGMEDFFVPQWKPCVVLGVETGCLVSACFKSSIVPSFGSALYNIVSACYISGWGWRWG